MNTRTAYTFGEITDPLNKLFFTTGEGHKVPIVELPEFVWYGIEIDDSLDEAAAIIDKNIELHNWETAMDLAVTVDGKDYFYVSDEGWYPI